MNWLKGTLITVAFAALAVYAFSSGKVLEGIVYILVALGFGLMDMVRSEKFVQYKKPLNIASWVVIIAAVILFVALLRMDAYGW